MARPKGTTTPALSVFDLRPARSGGVDAGDGPPGAKIRQGFFGPGSYGRLPAGKRWIGNQGFGEMRRLAAWTILALALAFVAVSAPRSFASLGQSDPGCVVVAPEVTVHLPPSACRHAPVVTGSACTITTDDGRQISLPMKACDHGPQFVTAPPWPTPSGACELTTPEGVRVTLPDQACEHMPAAAKGIHGTDAGCVLTTSEGRIIQLPRAACDRFHVG